MWLLDVISIFSGAHFGLYLASKVHTYTSCWYTQHEQRNGIHNSTTTTTTTTRVDRLMAENKRLMEVNALLLEENRALCDRILRVAFSSDDDCSSDIDIDSECSYDDQHHDDGDNNYNVHVVCSSKGESHTTAAVTHQYYSDQIKTPDKIK
jgi:hypothetical protein